MPCSVHYFTEAGQDQMNVIGIKCKYTAVNEKALHYCSLRVSMNNKTIAFS